MKKTLLYLFYSLLFLLPASLLAQTPVTLPSTGTSYTENFDNLATALPNGFGVYLGATSTSLGTAVTAPILTPGSTTLWNATGAGFKNFASATGLTSSATSTDQGGATNRALGVRQTSSTGYDPGASFVFQIANTTGRTGFKLSFALQSLDVTSTVTRTTTWVVDYGLGASPASYTQATAVGTVVTGNTVFSNNTVTVDFGNALDNQSGLVTIRISALAGTTGSGSRASTGIDDFALSWTNGSAATPTLTPSVTSLDFGTTTNVGSSATKTFTISGANLTAGASLSLSGAGASQYLLSTDGGTTYASTATIASAFTSAQTITIKFTPTSSTAATASIAIASTGATTQNISLTGTGVAVPTLTPSVTSLDFGSTTIIGQSATKTFTVSGANLTAGASLSLSGANASQYLLSTDGGTTYASTATIASAFTSAQTITVKFTPTGTTAAVASIAITSTGATTQNVSLTGTAISPSTPVLTATPGLLDFGTAQAVSSTSVAQSFTVSGTNIGTGGVTLTVAAPYSIATTAGGTYGLSITYTQAQMAGAQTVYVKFSPTVAGVANGSISITSTGATTQTVNLAGGGVAASSGGGSGASHVVISEIYGSNGNTYDYDWIELYNPTNAPVDMSNWSVQYNSATGTAAFSGITVFPAGTTIKAHGFFLIQEQGTAATGTALPTPDIATTGTTNNFNMSSSAGKVALVNNATLMTAKPTLPSASIIDFIGYGSTAAYYEGASYAPNASATTSLERKANANSTATTLATGGADELAGNGYDTDNNSTDFVSQATPNPQNSASAIEPSGSTSSGPTLTTAPSTLTFIQLVGGTSAAQSFTVTGTTLSTSVTVSVAAPYSLSTSATGTYAQSITLTSTQVASGAPVYVEFTPTTVGSANGTITVASTGATSQTVTLTGAGTSTAAPTLSATPSTLTFSQTVGSASAAQSFSVSGTNIPASGVSVSVAAPYTIATSATGTYGTSVSFTQLQMLSSQNVYVQFTPTATGAANGTATVAATGATSQTVTLNGTGIAPVNSAPTLAAINDVNICYTSAQQTIALTGITPGTEATQTVVLSISSTNPALFSQLGVFQAAGTTTGQINYTIAPNASGTAVVTVTVKDNGGTTGGGIDTYTRSFNLTVNSLPNVNITSNVGTNITKGVTAQLTASAGGATYIWSPSADIISGQNTATVTVRPKASETFTVVVTNASGCSTTQTISLNVGTLYPLITSNIITPNGDGKNDTWMIKNIDYYPTSSVKVVDKAGKVVFTATNYLNDWGGTYNGQPLTQGTYYYVIDLGSGAPKYTGYLTIIRD